MSRKLVMLAALATVVLVGSTALAEAKKISVGVQDLEAKKVDKDTVSTLTDILCTEMSKDKRYEVSCADDLRAILEHSGLNIKMGGCDDGECLKQLGTALEKDKFVSGSVGKIGDAYIITLKMSDVASGKVEKRHSETVKGDVGKLLDGIKLALQNLLK